MAQFQGWIRVSNRYSYLFLTRFHLEIVDVLRFHTLYIIGSTALLTLLFLLCCVTLHFDIGNYATVSGHSSWDKPRISSVFTRLFLCSYSLHDRLQPNYLWLRTTVMFDVNKIYYMLHIFQLYSTYLLLCYYLQMLPIIHSYSSQDSLLCTRS